MAWGSGARPVVLVTKADLGAEALVADLGRRLAGVEVIPVAVPDRTGIDAVARAPRPRSHRSRARAVGAGGSSLVNALLDEDRLAIGDVRTEDAARPPHHHDA